MSALSDHLENALADHALGLTTYTPGATLTLKLYTTAPSDSAGGTEVSGGSYAAVSITNNTLNFPVCETSGDPRKTNGTVFQFPTASAAWGLVTHWALWNSTNLLAYGAFSPSNYVSLGDAPRIAIGALDIKLLNGSAGGFTASIRRKLLDMVFGLVSYTKPTTVYASAGTSLSSEILTESGDTNYARASITFGAGSGGVSTSSSAAEVNPNVAADGETISYYGIWDDAVSGSPIALGALQTPRSPVIGQTLGFSSGQLALTLQ